MTEPTTLQEIIVRIEKGTGPDREIDHAIHATMNGADDFDANKPRYTGSVDAAMTLVPEGWAWFVQWIGKPFSEGSARLWIPSQRTQGLRIENLQSEGATPALALCIAALRARLTTEKHK